LDQDFVECLEEEFCKTFPHEPSWEQQSLADRVRRSLSWIKRAVRISVEDTPSRFAELWIALNALYGRRPYDEGFKPDDRRDFQHFLRLLESTDRAGGELPQLMRRIERRAYNLIDNKYLWKEFWRGNAAAQKKEAKEKRRESEQAISNNNAVTFLTLLFERLLVLRNQIFHGSASENTTKNEDALKPALLVLEDMLGVFLRLMIHHGPGRDWPLVPYPGKNTPQHPDRRR
jgi:hypothetical protein